MDKSNNKRCSPELGPTKPATTRGTLESDDCPTILVGRSCVQPQKSAPSKSPIQEVRKDGIKPCTKPNDPNKHSLNTEVLSLDSGVCLSNSGILAFREPECGPWKSYPSIDKEQTTSSSDRGCSSITSHRHSSVKEQSIPKSAPQDCRNSSNSARLSSRKSDSDDCCTTVLSPKALPDDCQTTVLSPKIDCVSKNQENLVRLHSTTTSSGSVPIATSGERTRQSPANSSLPAPLEDDVTWRYYQQDEDGDTQLHLSILLCPDTGISEHLINCCPNADLLNIRNKFFQTPLHLAVITNQPRIVRCLVSRGAQISSYDFEGNTPLHLACKLGQSECVLALTNRSIYVLQSIPLKDILRRMNYDGDTCCHLAFRSKNPQILFHLTDECSADINVQEGKRGLTILHIASESNNITMASFLLQQPSIEVNQLSYDGKTALDLAVSRMLSEMQQILEESGATSGPRSEPNSDSEDDDELMDSIDLNDLRI